MITVYPYPSSIRATICYIDSYSGPVHSWCMCMYENSKLYRGVIYTINLLKKTIFPCRVFKRDYPGGFQRVGTCIPVKMPEQIPTPELCGFIPTQAYKFFCLNSPMAKFNSKAYVRQRKTNKYTVSYRKDGQELYGYIDHFIKLSRSASDILALVCIQHFRLSHLRARVWFYLIS